MQFNALTVVRLIASIAISLVAIPYIQYAYRLVKELRSTNPYEMATVTFRGRELTGTRLYIYAAMVSFIPLVLLVISILIWPL